MCQPHVPVSVLFPELCQWVLGPTARKGLILRSFCKQKGEKEQLGFSPIPLMHSIVFLLTGSCPTRLLPLPFLGCAQDKHKQPRSAFAKKWKAL